MIKKFTTLTTACLVAASLSAQHSTDRAPENTFSTWTGPTVNNAKMLSADVRIFAFNAYCPATTIAKGPIRTYGSRPDSIDLLSPNPSHFYTGSAWNSDDDWISITSNNAFVSTDTTTGDSMLYWNYGTQVTGLTVNPLNDSLYGFVYNGTYSELHCFDIWGQTTHLIAGYPGSLFIALACNAAGEFYGLDLITDNMYRITLPSGTIDTLGPVGYDANYAQGAEFDLGTGTLYLTAYNSSSSAGELRTVNLSTGASTLIGTFEANCEIDGPIIFPSGSSVGIDQNLTNCPLQVYPNPVRDELNIVSGPMVHTLFIYDLTGQEVYQTAAGTAFTVPVSTLASGTYLIRYTTSTGTFTTRFEKE